METKLQKVHKETGIKQGFIADKAGLTHGAYSLIVRGVTTFPELPTAIRIARAWGKTVEELWGDEVD